MSVSSPAPVRSGLELVRSFTQLGREDVQFAGGKGANLGELTRAGLSVPEGFVVGAPAYAAFCAESELRERLAELLDALDVEDTAALQAASLAAREMVEAAPMPQELERDNHNSGSVQHFLFLHRSAGSASVTRSTPLMIM